MNAFYRLIRPLIFRQSAMSAHEQVMVLLRYADSQPWLIETFQWTYRETTPPIPVEVGGVALDSPLILAAGFVKGEGFRNEQIALEAVDHGMNIMPGWRAIPALVGAVEFGSFTRHPRLGNPGVVMWRDVPTRSTQNRIGLKNPGAVAAAAFLAKKRDQLPATYGINIATSPGVADPDQEESDVREALGAFVSRDLRPAWYTLNLSCPNTEDDPSGNQTDAKARRLGSSAVAVAGDVPVWVKVGPALGRAQYEALMAAFSDVGVRAVIATNTLPEPTPDGKQIAGVGGGRLHVDAVAAAQVLIATGRPVDVVGCGGVMDQDTLQAYRNLNIKAVQYWSALIYRGPLAGASIARDFERGSGMVS